MQLAGLDLHTRESNSVLSTQPSIGLQCAQFAVQLHSLRSTAQCEATTDDTIDNTFAMTVSAAD